MQGGYVNIGGRKDYDDGDDDDNDDDDDDNDYGLSNAGGWILPMGRTTMIQELRSHHCEKYAADNII